MAVSSLGAGSGVLTSDIIDKLKAADTASLITPIDSKITLQKQKGQALDLLNSLFTTFQTSVSSLNDSSLYQKRSVSGNSDAISVTADSGVATQSFSISNSVMALKDVQESGSFTSTDSKIATGDGTLSLGINGSTYQIPYTSEMTLEDLKTAINDSSAGDKLTASTLQVGTNDYRLILTSKETGANQVISLSDSGTTLNEALLSNKTIYSQAFSASTDLVASGASGTQTATLTMGSNTYNIDYTSATTLADFRDAINTAAGSTVASIDASNKLVIKAGSSIFSLTDAAGGALDSKITGYTVNGLDEIQKAQDASFTYNGIPITRSSNTITDLMTGVTINLLQDAGSSNFAITQDVQSISDAMSSFVQNYNTLTSQLSSMTTADITAGTVGIFNGDSSITGIGRDITRLVTSMDTQGYSLAQFGIDLAEDGTMSFNSSTFTTKFNQDTTLSEQFFSGLTTYDTNGNVANQTDGVFTQLNALTERYMGVYGSDGILDTLTTASTNEQKTLMASKTKAQALLDARYATMTARFIEYDTLMTKLNNQFSSLSQQINMAINGG